MHDEATAIREADIRRIGIGVMDDMAIGSDDEKCECRVLPFIRSRINRETRLWGRYRPNHRKAVFHD